jgi:hypothetical protein
VLFAGVGFPPVDDAVAMFRRSVERIEPERRIADAYDVVTRAGGDDDRVVVLDPMARAIDDDFALALLDAKELVVWMPKSGSASACTASAQRNVEALRPRATSS